MSYYILVQQMLIGETYNILQLALGCNGLLKQALNHRIRLCIGKLDDQVGDGLLQCGCVLPELVSPVFLLG